jgi:hypothetical protein
MKFGVEHLQTFLNRFGVTPSWTKENEFELNGHFYVYRHTVQTESSNGNPQWVWTGIKTIVDFRELHADGTVILEAAMAEFTCFRLSASKLLEANEADTQKYKQRTGDFAVSVDLKRSQKRRMVPKLVHASRVTHSVLEKEFRKATPPSDASQAPQPGAG